MLIIRLLRIGKKNQPSFRIVLTEKTAPPTGGKFLEVLGSYNPSLKQINLKKERIKYWLSQGVQTSETVHNLLVKQEVIKGPKRIKKIKTKRRKKEEIEEGPEEKKEEQRDKEPEKKEEKIET